jgi:hypothetical protein
MRVLALALAVLFSTAKSTLAYTAAPYPFCAQVDWPPFGERSDVCTRPRRRQLATHPSPPSRRPPTYRQPPTPHRLRWQLHCGRRQQAACFHPCSQLVRVAPHTAGWNAHAPACCNGGMHVTCASARAPDLQVWVQQPRHGTRRPVDRRPRCNHGHGHDNVSAAQSGVQCHPAAVSVSCCTAAGRCWQPVVVERDEPASQLVGTCHAAHASSPPPPPAPRPRRPQVQRH